MGEIGDLEFGIHKKFKNVFSFQSNELGPINFLVSLVQLEGKKSGQTAHCALWCYLLDGIFFIFYFFPCNLLDLKQRHE